MRPSNSDFSGVVQTFTGVEDIARLALHKLRVPSGEATSEYRWPRESFILMAPRFDDEAPYPVCQLPHAVIRNSGDNTDPRRKTWQKD